MTRTLNVEWRVLTGSLQTVPAIHDLFLTLHQLELMARSVGRFNEEFVRDFYATAVATLRGSFDRLSNLAKQAPLTYVRLRGCRVNISLPVLSLPCLTIGGPWLSKTISSKTNLKRHHQKVDFPAYSRRL